MGKQSYPGADEGTKGETGEREPRNIPKADDKVGRHEGKVNGVAMGKADQTGRSNGGHETGQFNTGRSESVCYTHKKGC